MATKYVLEMTDEQAAIAAAAFEFYTRMRLGQFRELVKLVVPYSDEDWLTKTTDGEDALLEARKILLPDLAPHWGHSYGVYNFPETLDAWQLCQAVRSCRAWQKHPEGGLTVDFDKPIPHEGKPVPVCRAVEEETDG